MANINRRSSASKPTRFRKQDSARSGFTYVKRILVNDEGALVGPDEFDEPPPSEESLGGEGDISEGDVRVNSDTFTVPPENKIPTQFVTAAGGVNYSERILNDDIPTNYSFVQIAGSNAAITLDSNPQISGGSNERKLTVKCVGSNVTLIDGSGLSLKSNFNMDSGSLINFMYDSSNSVWRETSRALESF